MAVDVWILYKALLYNNPYQIYDKLSNHTLNPKPQNELFLNCAITFAFIPEHYRQ